jgi:nitroimidazol reductase NimA-like FMN-containing flavoprotein (pyridoxamine 5'-phosphate oxidase superfamily)
MLIHELSADECLEVLRRTTLGRLACSHHDQPYVVPVHFSYDADRHCLYGFSTVGQKIEWMRDNPKVCVEIEDIENKDWWATVLAFGRYEEVGDAPEEAAVRQRVWELFQQRSEWWLPATAKVGGARERHNTVVYGIQIDRVTGRRSTRQRV